MHILFLTKHKFDNIKMNPEIHNIISNRLQTTYIFGTYGMTYSILKLLSNEILNN